MPHATPPLVLALSGPVCAGKTTLAQGLEEAEDAVTLTTRRLIAARAGLDATRLTRRRLQDLGEELDRVEGGRWVAAALGALLGNEQAPFVVIDALRTEHQLRAVQDIGSTIHVHLTAPLSLLRERYELRRLEEPALELASFAEMRKDPTESAVDELGRRADLRIDTSEAGVREVRTRVAALLRRTSSGA